MSNQRSFTPQVKDSVSQSNSEHFDKESRDYLPSICHENQSEGDSESTDDGFDRFTSHQVHLSTSRQWLCLSCVTSSLFSPIDWNNFYCKTFDHCTFFFVFKHEKQRLSYIHSKFKGNRIWNRFFSPNLFWGGAPVFFPNTQNYLGLRGWCPWNYLVWIGLKSSSSLMKLNKSFRDLVENILLFFFQYKYDPVFWITFFVYRTIEQKLCLMVSDLHWEFELFGFTSVTVSPRSSQHVYGYGVRCVLFFVCLFYFVLFLRLSKTSLVPSVTTTEEHCVEMGKARGGGRGVVLVPPLPLSSYKQKANGLLQKCVSF